MRFLTFSGKHSIIVRRLIFGLRLWKYVFVLDYSGKLEMVLFMLIFDRFFHYFPELFHTNDETLKSKIHNSAFLDVN